jgi:hypothetical protein
VVGQLTHLLHIRNVQGSNFGPQTGYAEVSGGFIQSLHAYSGIVP